MRDEMQVDMSDRLSNIMLDIASDEIPEKIFEHMWDGMSEYIWDKMS